jgi:hypothetical protein
MTSRLRRITADELSGDTAQEAIVVNLPGL